MRIFIMHVMGHTAGERYFPVIGRVLLALVFIIAGVGKIFGFAGTVGYIASVGLPFPEVLAVLAIVIEVGGGLALALGYQTRHAAWALALFTLVATVFFHNNIGDQLQQVMALKNLAILGGLLYVIKYGPGMWCMGSESARHTCTSCGCGTGSTPGSTM